MGVEPMKRKLLLLAIFLSSTACQRYVGPVEIYRKNRSGDVADARDAKGNPIYSIPEQERRGRSRLVTVENSPFTGPNTYDDRPGGVGR